MCDSFTAPFIPVFPRRDIICVDILCFIGGIGPISQSVIDQVQSKPSSNEKVITGCALSQLCHGMKQILKVLDFSWLSWQISGVVFLLVDWADQTVSEIAVEAPLAANEDAANTVNGSKESICLITKFSTLRFNKLI